MATRTTTLIAGALAGATLLAAACGDDDPAAGDTSAVSATTVAADTTAAAETTAAVGTTAVGSSSEPAGDVPQRIVSLSATATEMLFAIGAGQQVIAVDSTSNYPSEAEAVLTDLSAFEPNVEAIAGYEPDLVVHSGTVGLTEQLEALDIEVWEGPAAATFGDAYAQIEQLGAITGHVGDAAEVVANMQADLEEIAQSVPTSEVPLTYYHELDDTLFSVTSSTFIGEVYSLFGLQNIADQVEGDSGGYPQLNAEFIVEESPDLIFLADTICCGESAETVAARPGWGAIAAVEDDLVFEMSDDLASRWGPRIVDYARAVRDAVEQAAARQPAG
ncbi:MAG: ABC transporter substrate-binding protein [Ilumatobacteraceae bacterium]